MNECIEAVSKKYGVNIGLQPGTRVRPVHFNEDVVALVKQTAEENPQIQQQGEGEMKGRVLFIKSGPFHDAMKFGEIMPAVMLFVPSVGGISHDKAEFTHPEDLDTGVEILTGVVRKLIGERAIVQG